KKDSTNDESGVSLRPSDYEKAERPPDLADIRSYTPKGERDDIATIDLPLYCRRALETLGHAAKSPPSRRSVGASSWTFEAPGSRRCADRVRGPQSASRRRQRACCAARRV